MRACRFPGDEIALPADGLFEVHSRCFALFNEVARIRPGESGRFPSISKRELECLKLAANGNTSEEIARLLKLSVHTANQYLTRRRRSWTQSIACMRSPRRCAWA